MILCCMNLWVCMYVLLKLNSILANCPKQHQPWSLDYMTIWVILTWFISFTPSCKPITILFMSQARSCMHTCTYSILKALTNSFNIQVEYRSCWSNMLLGNLQSLAHEIDQLSILATIRYAAHVQNSKA